MPGEGAAALDVYTHLPLQPLIGGGDDAVGVLVTEHLTLDDEGIALAHEVSVTDDAVAVMVVQQGDLLAGELQGIEVNGDAVAKVGQHPACIGNAAHLAPLVNREAGNA